MFKFWVHSRNRQGGFTCISVYISRLTRVNCKTFFFQDEKSLEKAVNERKTHDVHESVHRETIMKVTNKMQLYRLIYYS